MKALVVLNGDYYAGENKDENKLIFIPERAKAVPVDEKRLKFIIDAISGWVMNDVIQLKRLEVLREKRVKKNDRTERTSQVVRGGNGEGAAGQ